MKKVLIFIIAKELFTTGLKIANWAAIHNEKDDFDEVWRSKMLRDYHQVNKIMEKAVDFSIWAEDNISSLTDKIKGNKK